MGTYYHIFLDMDGVLTDFVSAVRKLGEGPAKGLGDGPRQEDRQAMDKAVEEAGEAFWSKMPWMKDGRELWKVFKPFRPTILTAPGKFTTAKIGKTEWVRNNIPGTSLFFSNTKYEYVDRYEPSILIDDQKPMIDAWEQAGGIGILHQSLANTERQFLELLWNNPSTVKKDYLKC